MRAVLAATVLAILLAAVPPASAGIVPEAACTGIASVEARAPQIYFLGLGSKCRTTDPQVDLGEGDALTPVCWPLQNARNILGLLQPLEAAAPACWTASRAVGPAPEVPGEVHGAAACAKATERVGSSAYALCGAAMSGLANARASVTQMTVSCTSDGRSCTYQPTYHASLSQPAPGEWVLRTRHQLVSVSPFGGGVVAGSQQSVECRLEGPLAACHAAADTVQITAGNSNTYRWEGAWALWYVDPAGGEHLQATGSASKYVAQYY